MKYYLIAGERSGDLHGAALIRELKTRDPEAKIRCWGGDLMQKSGGYLVKHYRELAFMGFWEVLKNLRTIKENLKFCKQDVSSWKPDVIIFIDYPGFNLRIAKFAHENNFKTCYYISPKIWAWKESRIKGIKAHIDKMYCILPFEPSFYSKHNYAVDYVGNPLVTGIKEYHYNTDFINNQPASKFKIAVMPGSRKQEVEHMAVVMQQAIRQNKDMLFYILTVNNLSEELYKPFSSLDNAQLVPEKNYDVLSIADGAIVTSGTATLEVALFQVPQIVCYKTSWLTYKLAKAFIKVKYISLVNLIAGKEVVKELIQEQLSAGNISAFLEELQANTDNIKKMRQEYIELREIIGSKNAPAETAKEIISFLMSPK